MKDIQQFQTVYAEFKPKNLSTLKPEAKKYIGIKSKYEAGWIIEEEDSKQFAGQRAFINLELPCDGFAWVPEEDLKIISVMERK